MTALNWIWLDPTRYPERQKTRYAGDWSAEGDDGTVVEFAKRVSLGKPVERIELLYSSDATSQIWINGSFLGTGPVLVGGDFLANERPRTNRYYSSLTLTGGEDDHLASRLHVDGLDAGEIDILARVRLCPVQICEFSTGHGGFAMRATVYFTDGTGTVIHTDESWSATLCPEYERAGEYDARRNARETSTPRVTEDIWQPTRSPLPHRVERWREPIGEHSFTVGAGKTIEVTLEYDMIYAAYTHTRARASGEVEIELTLLETNSDTVGKQERIVFVGNGEYVGVRMYSVGLIRARIANRSASTATVELGINEVYLPSAYDCRTVTSDEELNSVLDVARHTLKYCRQYIHLDSPKHCEPMACTGDYFIESEMESFSLGDGVLADFDVVRTARILEHNGGVMFHPTYSLIWARMLINVYKRNGRLELLCDCEGALDLLLNVFRGYIGKCGLIDTPPSFMFVDWIYIDGISLHHPPKALGQGVMNTLYYDALLAAAEVYAFLGKSDKENECKKEAIKLRESIMLHLYDGERGMFFEGLNTPTPSELVNQYMPENVEKRYYRINTNALAVYAGVVEGEQARELLCRVLDSGEFDYYQPYFAHFVLGAVHRAGLDEKYLMPILDKWRDPVKACAKGLAEGFIPPEPTYVFDHSHAWGGTPLYSLPMALCSLEILEPGMSRIALTPRLLGFSHASVEIPTPHGVVALEMKEGEPARVSAPDGVTVTLKE